MTKAGVGVMWLLVLKMEGGVTRDYGQNAEAETDSFRASGRSMTLDLGPKRPIWDFGFPEL